MMFISQYQESFELAAKTFQEQNNRPPTESETSAMKNKSVFSVNLKKWHEERQKNKRKNQEIMESGRAHPKSRWSNGSEEFFQENMEKELFV
jgi:hypothetical protein